jgi:3-isopropylmalate/(R)-2-methylmalate dehydratase small subunit
VERTGFGQFLFYDWRYRPDGELDSSFVLNDEKYKGASILVSGANFGCGSSREHAPWSLADFGFRAVIASSFADIFANNCTKNGLLPVVLSEEEVETLLKSASSRAGYELTIDLHNREVRDNDGFTASFHIPDFQRQCLLEGLDDIALTLKHEPDISAFEQRRPAWSMSAG